ncbi:MAG: NgoFVII family restriction endonuclease [Candidatus Woesearchaeota archaeon]|jgi:hypothetical protein
MLFNSLPNNKKRYYEKMLVSVCSLSRLFSENEIPYLDSRMAENIYCKSFDARNVSREDSAIDAVLDHTGIGVKTFQGNSSQKISEFDKDRELFANLSDVACVKKISELRNERLNLAKRTYGVTDLIYHYIKREKGKILIVECSMDLIDIAHIETVVRNRSSISFNDGKHQYTFNISKSVLMMKFSSSPALETINIKILNDPFEIIHEKISALIAPGTPLQEYPYIILPLYATTGGLNNVPEKSGLNQWNAGGRSRSEDEVYIRIPLWIHRKFSGFFPSRSTPFDLDLPDGNSLKAKICQAGGKALMSKHNKDLGKWILRDILKMSRGQLVTYKKLQTLGIDSVIVKKISTTKYTIDFSSLGTFDEFEKENKS